MSLLSEEKINEIFDLDPNMGPGDWKGYKRAALVMATRAIEAAVLEAQKQEPVAWCVAYDDPRMGRIHSNPSMCEPEVDTHVSKCGGVVVKVPLYAAPVVQPDMVLVPREATPEMVSAGYSKITMEIENSSRDISDVYRAMIAAAEGKE